MAFHIVRSKDQFQVVLLAKNGEVLSTSERLKSKQGCWRNIKSQLKEITEQNVKIQDDTLLIPLLYLFNSCGGKLKMLHERPSPKYVPGKNKRSK